MRRLIPALLVLAAAAAVPGPARPLAAQQAEAAERTGAAILLVTVADDSTGRALPGASVRVSGVARPGETDSRGRAQVRDLAPGPHLVQVNLPGYAMRRFSVVATPGDTLEAEVGLVPQIQEVVLEGLTVTSWGRRRALVENGFYDRQNQGTSATFLPREQVMRYSPQRLTEVFRRVQGFQLVPNRRTGRMELQTTRGQGTLRGACVPDVYLDGVRMGTARESDGLGMLDGIAPESVEGIEAYPSSVTVPAQYNVTGAACGVVLVWTQTGS